MPRVEPYRVPADGVVLATGLGERARAVDVLALLAAIRPAWMADAACRGHDPRLWFPERGADVRPAKQICATCPVAGECAEAGAGEVGIWGGLSARERRRSRATAA